MLGALETWKGWDRVTDPPDKDGEDRMIFQRFKRLLVFLRVTATGPAS